MTFLNKQSTTDLPNPEQETFWEKHKRPIFLVALFIVVFLSARIAIRPINDSDYNGYIATLKVFWSGQSPYEARVWHYPPWSFFILAPLVNEPIETWLALSVAIFATMIVDMGRPSGLLLLLHPVFITLVASSNGEWLFVGPGLWLLRHTPKGWGRGLAWLFLTNKIQTTFVLLLIDGWVALRERDWKAMALSAGVALGTIALYPQLFKHWSQLYTWSTSVLPNYGLLGAILVTVFFIVVRWRRLADRNALGVLLGPVWSPYMLQYSYMATIFTMRGAGWIRTSIYVAACIGLALLFWREYHVAEQVGMLGMLLLTAIMAPTALYPDSKPVSAITPS